MNSAQAHLAKLDKQIADYWQDCFDIFAQFISRKSAERMAWLVTADAFRGVA